MDIRKWLCIDLEANIKPMDITPPNMARTFFVKQIRLTYYIYILYISIIFSTNLVLERVRSKYKSI